MARPRYQPTDAQRQLVQSLAGAGLRQIDIINIVGDVGGKPLCDKTLRRYFRVELARGESVANAKIARRLFDLAMEGNPTALIYWTKSRMGWRESPQAVELSGKDGQQMPAGIQIFLPQKDPPPEDQPPHNLSAAPRLRHAEPEHVVELPPAPEPPQPAALDWRAQVEASSRLRRPEDDAPAQRHAGNLVQGDPAFAKFADSMTDFRPRR